MTTPGLVGLLQVEIVHERPSAHCVACHARSVSLERGVLPGDLALPADTPPEDPAPPARVTRIHREPFGRGFRGCRTGRGLTDRDAPAARRVEHSGVRAGTSTRVRGFIP